MAVQAANAGLVLTSNLLGRPVGPIDPGSGGSSNTGSTDSGASGSSNAGTGGSSNTGSSNSGSTSPGTGYYNYTTILITFEIII